MTSTDTEGPRPDSIAGLLSEPEQRWTAEALVLDAVDRVQPGEVAAAADLIGPLMDQIARGEGIEPGPGDGPGGFGGTELVVCALAPLVLQALANLVRELGRGWAQRLRMDSSAPRADGQTQGDPGPFALSLEEAGTVLRLTGIPFRPDDLPKLLRAVHEALLASVEQGADPIPDRTSRKRPLFRDLALRFEPDVDGGFQTEILPTTGGGAPADFKPRFPIADLPWIVQGLERSARGDLRTLHAAGHAQARRDPTGFGGDLFEALFTGGVRDAYERASAAASAQGEGLRLRLVLDPAYPALCACPWELLFDRRRGLFLCHDLATPVVRQLETTMPQLPRLAPPDSRLRVLVASAQPTGTSPLAARDELAAIVEALRCRPGVEVASLPDASSEALRRELRRVSPHILHFIGHGTFDEAAGEGKLLLADTANHCDSLSGEELSALVCGLDDLRLIVLNACNTARLPRRDGFDVFSGTAAALIKAGFPAVLAMQFPISDDASVLFAEAFYEALGAGDPVEAALVEGRQAILGLDRRRGGFEWATPVLYLRVQDGDLFGFGGRADPHPPGGRP